MRFYKIEIWNYSKIILLFNSIGCSYKFLEKVYPNSAAQSNICYSNYDQGNDVDETITNCASAPDKKLVISLSQISESTNAHCFFGFRPLCRFFTM